MVMRVVVPIITALIMLAVGALWMLTVFIGMNGFNEQEGIPILVANLVMVIIAIVISSVVSGLLADVLQKRSGMSPLLAGPLTIVVVTVVANIAIFLIGTVIIMVVDSTRKRPPLPQQQPRRLTGAAGGDKQKIHATLITPDGVDYGCCVRSW